MWINLINGNLTASGFSSASIQLQSSSGANITASWSVSVNSNNTNLNGLLSNQFQINITIGVSSACGTSCTAALLNINANWGGSSMLQQFVLNPTTNSCNLTLSAGEVVVFTLSGSVTVSSGNAFASMYSQWWAEIWAELINALMGSNSPFYGKTLTWPGSGNALSYYVVSLFDSNGNNIGSWNSQTSSGSNITSVTVSASSSSGQTAYVYSSTWSINATFNILPSTSDTLYQVSISVYLNASKPSSAATQAAAYGAIATAVYNINYTVNQGSTYTIVVTESASVQFNT